MEGDDSAIRVQGYLEHDGYIMKVSSFADIQQFVLRFGESVHAMTEDELDRLTAFENETTFSDASFAVYIEKPLILKKGSSIENNYAIKEGTVAVANNAFHKERSDGNPARNTLMSIRMLEGIIAIGTDAFSYNYKLSKINLPQSLLKISDRAFNKCISLKDLTLPSNLLYIGSYAFAGTSIETIVIPQHVRKIGAHAFDGCKQLKEIVFEGMPLEVGIDIFHYCDVKYLTIYVPYHSMEYFKEILYPEPSNLIEKSETIATLK